MLIKHQLNANSKQNYDGKISCYCHGSQSKGFAVLVPIKYELESSIILKFQARKKRYINLKVKKACL